MTGPTEAQHRRMHALWRIAGVSDRDDRLALTREIVQRPITTSNELTEDQAARVIRYMSGLEDRGQLAAQARGWLARNRSEVSK